MSSTNSPIYSLLPAVFRSRDAAQGGQLAALFEVLETQYGIVRDNLEQLYDDQFIETCAPWVIPYIGQLIGYNPVYTLGLDSPDSRAEVANIMGYRRRKGTLLAMEQLTHDVSGRTTMVVEEFRRLVTTLSLRDVRPCHNATANLRRGRDWEECGCGGDGQNEPFSRLNRTIDVRRIAPRVRTVSAPDMAPLEIALHGGGRSNIPNGAVWIWRWQSWPITNAPAFALGGGGYFFSALGNPVPLFQQPPAAPLPFTRLITEKDAPQPVSRRRFAEDMTAFYPSSFSLLADGSVIDASQIICANLSDGPDGTACGCKVPARKIAIDPELGRIQYAADLALPESLRVSYSYGAAAQMGGGAYDRTANVAMPEASFTAVVGTAEYPSLETAVAAWNARAPGTAGIIYVPNYESYTVDLSGMDAIQIAAESQLLIVAAEMEDAGTTPLFRRSCATLFGHVEVVGLSAPSLPAGVAAPMGQLQINGIHLAGEIRVSGQPCCVQIVDSTLVPGRTLNHCGEPAQIGDPSISGDATGAFVCLNRSISGPVALDPSCSVRVTASILDACSAWCPAFAGPELASGGATLHIEDSTVIGRVWTRAMRLASNTIFHARLGRRDPWQAAVWATRRQVGCVRFCSLPHSSLTPRRYECLPPDAASEAALEPRFITLRYGRPGYCLLSGDVPMAVWKGASNGSQMGVYLQIQETETVTNVQIRSQEYLPANLECGVFLVPSRPVCDTAEADQPYGYGSASRATARRCKGVSEMDDDLPIGIGIGLI